MELLRHTFAMEVEAVQGMPELYQKLELQLERPPFFYLSASPYNLFPMLRSFVYKNYPHGQLLLREMSWQEIDSFVLSLTVGTQQYKEKELEKLISRLPKCKWLFIGDSTQKDPESYASTYRKHPETVKHIWIRIVEGVDQVQEKGLNSVNRFKHAFNGVPEGVWKLFRDPQELDMLLATLEN